MRSRFGQIIEHCRKEIGLMNNVFLYFIKRSNMVAHQFARASYKFLDRCFNSSNVPVS